MIENTSIKSGNQRIGELALRTAQWCNACLYQFLRFIDVCQKPTEGKLPWEQGEISSLLQAEKQFLITAVYQTICYLDELQKALQKKDDPSLEALLDAIASKEQREEIRQWRNINEHERDYIKGTGIAQKRHPKNPDAFLSDFFVGVTDGMVYINGNTKEFYLGRIRIDHLLFRLKENHSDILKRTKEIFGTYYYGLTPQDASAYLPQEERP